MRYYKVRLDNAIVYASTKKQEALAYAEKLSLSGDYRSYNISVSDKNNKIIYMDFGEDEDEL